MREIDKYELLYWIISIILIGFASCITYYAAIKAVKIGSRLNYEQNKDMAKRELFLTLYAYRSLPVHQNFVDSLNKIDIVFHKENEVQNAWHKYYDELQIKGRADDKKVWEIHRVDLLSEMAKSLGYGELKQTDILKTYYPESFDMQISSDAELRQEFSNYLRTGFMAHQFIVDYLKDKTQDFQQHLKDNKIIE